MSDIIYDWEWKCESLDMVFRFDVIFSHEPQTPNVIDRVNGSTPGEGIVVTIVSFRLIEVHRVLDSSQIEPPTPVSIGSELYPTTSWPSLFLMEIEQRLLMMAWRGDLSDLEDAIRRQIESESIA